MVQSYVRELLKGVTDPLLLSIISELPVHGYQIAKELERRSQGYFKLTASTIYSALRRLESRGLVLSSWQQATHNQNRRCYQLTDKGQQILKEELTQWRRFLGATEKVIEDHT